jgi:hypothetical protein
MSELSLVLLILMTALFSETGSAVIYGEDSRVDRYQFQEDEGLLTLSRSVAAVVGVREMAPGNDGLTFRLNQTPTLKERKRTCSEVKFADQRTMGFCTSFLVSSYQVVMARHCLAAGPCSGMRFVFDFALADSTATAEDLQFRADDVYRCVSYAYPRDETSHVPGDDFVVVDLDRPVWGREPLSLRSGPALSTDDLFMTIGHPNGLPQKLASGGRLLSQKGEFFFSDLDTFHGNSGSPVFNARTHEVEGVLVDGEVDFELGGSCRVPRVCTVADCRGEKILDISRVKDFL